jgi:hypothetical protein
MARRGCIFGVFINTNRHGTISKEKKQMSNWIIIHGLDTSSVYSSLETENSGDFSTE